MPTGPYTRRFEKDNFKPRKEVKRTVAMYNWLDWLSHLESKSIKHKMNNANEKIDGPYYIDGYDSITGELYEFQGYYWHAHLSVQSGKLK